MDLLRFSFFFLYSVNKHTRDTEPNMRAGPQSSAVHMTARDEGTCFNVVKLFRSHAKLRCLDKGQSQMTCHTATGLCYFSFHKVVNEFTNSITCMYGELLFITSLLLMSKLLAGVGKTIRMTKFLIDLTHPINSNFPKCLFFFPTKHVLHSHQLNLLAHSLLSLK